jgi:dTMP kinase
MAKDGLFLVIDGPDGGGKTTQARLLGERIAAAGREVVALREPGGTLLGEKLRSILLSDETGDLDPATETLLLQAARRRLVQERIRPALERGQVVVCDRWHFATMAYQSGGGGLDPAVVRVTTRIATDGLDPRRAVILDVDEAVAERRLADRAKDRIERRDLGYRRRVRQAFRTLMPLDPDRIVLVDGNRPVEEVAEDVWRAFRDLL